MCPSSDFPNLWTTLIKSQKAIKASNKFNKPENRLTCRGVSAKWSLTSPDCRETWSAAPGFYMTAFQTWGSSSSLSFHPAAPPGTRTAASVLRDHSHSLSLWLFCPPAAVGLCCSSSPTETAVRDITLGVTSTALPLHQESSVSGSKDSSSKGFSGTLWV